MAYDLDRLRREEFPWAAGGEAVFLNAASTGPLPERSIRAQDAFTRKRAAPYRLSQAEQFGVLDVAREGIARLIGADVREVALATNTGTGINLAAWSLPLGAGDEVVLSDLEFPANMYPWMAAAAARGFTLRRVPARDGIVDEAALLDAIQRPAVKVLAVSWVGFATGAVVDLDVLGAACRQRGVAFVVDAIQGLVPLALDVRRTPVDIVACGAQKWLLSPWGSGFTYVRRELIPRLPPQPVSWMGVRDSDDFSRLLDYDLTWRGDARRYEQVTLPFQDFAGMGASLALLEELGHDAVRAHIGRCVQALVDGADRVGIPVVTPRKRMAGIVSVRPRDAMAASARLDAAKVIHSVREGTIRLAPHCYTTDAELASALQALEL